MNPHRVMEAVWMVVWMTTIGGVQGQDTLHAPLTIPLQFSGNFGEIRTGHFHTGMDIRTEGREGVPVLAAQDGAIARIKVSDRGYGLALYLDGGGLTTVYGHLSAFHPAIESWLMDHQYASEQWAYDGRPDTTFWFAAGDTIGWSGNSGGSFGPHLHFEVREARTQFPINPLQWKFMGQSMSEDLVPPEFRGVWIVPVEGAAVEGQADRFRWTPAYGVGVRVAGAFTVGVEAFDRLDGEPFTHGPFGMDVRWGDSLVYRHRMDTLSFSTNGDVSAHIDLPAWQDRKARVHRVQRLPGNRLDIYQGMEALEPWTVNPGDSVLLEVGLLDLAGNETHTEMWLFGDSLVSAAVAGLSPTPLDFRKEHHLKVGRMAVEIPARALYGHAVVNIEEGQEDGRFQVWSEARVTRSDYTLTMPVPEVFIGSGDPLVLCAVDSNGGVEETWVADERNGQLRIKLSRFGHFEIRPDSVSPRLDTPELQDGMLTLKVEDELSGIARWEGRCGDQWLRWSMDKGVLSHRLSDGMLQGHEEDEVKVWVIDRCGNIGQRTFTLASLLGQ